MQDMTSYYFQIGAIDGNPIQVERCSGMFYLDNMPLKTVEVVEQNKAFIVHLQTLEKDFYLSGAEYWKLLHEGQNEAISRNKLGLVVARLHQKTRFPLVFLGISAFRDWLTR